MPMHQNITIQLPPTLIKRLLKEMDGDLMLHSQTLLESLKYLVRNWNSTYNFSTLFDIAYPPRPHINDSMGNFIRYDYTRGELKLQEYFYTVNQILMTYSDSIEEDEWNKDVMYGIFCQYSVGLYIIGCILNNQKDAYITDEMELI